jgi:voltage-gated potassium channel
MSTSKSLALCWWQTYGQRRFGILLVILLALLAGPPALVGMGLSPEWFEGLMSLLLLAAILSLCVERRQRGFAILLGVPTILFSLVGHTLPEGIGRWVLFVGHLCEAAFLFGAAALIVRSLFNADSLSFDSIFGAVCGYLFLGLGWAVLYLMIEQFQPGSFEASRSLIASAEHSPISSDVLSYYSFVTLTTVGYGDVTPLSPTTRTLAWIEAMTGQFYLAVVVAGLVSLIIMKNSRPPRNPAQQID